jgi:hypothetical protein
MMNLNNFAQKEAQLILHGRKKCKYQKSSILPFVASYLCLEPARMQQTHKHMTKQNLC